MFKEFIICGGVLYLVRSPMDGWTFSGRWIGVLDGLLDGGVGHSKGRLEFYIMA